MKIVCPRLVCDEKLYRTESKDNTPIELDSNDVMFGYLCFLEFGSFDFCTEVDVKFDSCLLINNFKGSNEFKSIQSSIGLHEIEIISDVNVLKLLGNTVWDETFYLVLQINFNNDTWGIFDLTVANNKKINEYMQKSIFKKLKRERDDYEFQKNVFDDEYEINIMNYQDMFLPKKKKEKKQLKKEIEKQPQEITSVITTFSFLNGIKDIKYETIPPLRYKRANVQTVEK